MIYQETNMKSKILYITILTLWVGSVSAYTGPFTDVGNGTILDQKSGLVWQKCANGQGSAADFYSDCTIGAAVNLDWTNALAYCNTLNLAGAGGWRLPSLKELISLIDYSRAASPLINPTFFPNSGGTNYYWTSTSHHSNANKNQAYSVLFTGGTYDTNDKSTTTSAGVFMRVRCVK